MAAVPTTALIQKPRLRSICHVHGLPIDARSVTDEVMMMEDK